MTAVEMARRFAYFRVLQRSLRLYEAAYGDVCGLSMLRRHVIEEMRKLAKLMRYASAAVLLTLSWHCLDNVALARDDGRYAQSPLKDWVRGLKDKNGNGCCDTSDGFPAEVEWDTQRENYRVRIDGVWYVVPPDAVLAEPNKLGIPMVWYWFKDGVPQIRCFIAGAAG